MQQILIQFIEFLRSLVGLDSNAAIREREAAVIAEREAARKRQAAAILAREDANVRNEPGPVSEKKSAARRTGTAVRFDLGTSRKTQISVRIGYINSDELTSERTIDVFSMGHGYIDAYCHLRHEIRIFRTDRVLWSELTAESFNLPSEYLPTEWVKTGEGSIRE